MSVFRYEASVGAGATVENILAGSKFEFLQRPSAVRVFAAQDSGDLGQLDFTLGNVIIGENLALPKRVAGEGPSMSDDKLVAGVGMPSDRIQIRVRETGGAAPAIVRVMVEISELA